MNLFSNKGYDVIISIHDLANKTLSSDTIYIVDAIMWPQFGNSIISIRGGFLGQVE